MKEDNRQTSIRKAHLRLHLRWVNKTKQIRSMHTEKKVYQLILYAPKSALLREIWTSSPLIYTNITNYYTWPTNTAATTQQDILRGSSGCCISKHGGGAIVSVWFVSGLAKGQIE